jgi:hypothetical protein
MATTSHEYQATLKVPEGSKTIHDTLEGGRYHLVLGISPEMNQALEDLALRYRTDKGGVLSLAVGLLKNFSVAADEGKRVGIVGDDTELETEITGL